VNSQGAKSPRAEGFAPSRLRCETPGRLTVTDHAIVRYFERVLGVDLDEVREQILPRPMRVALQKLKANGEFACGTHLIRVQNNRVVTILKEREKKRED
jgi:hypothetical protein